MTESDDSRNTAWEEEGRIDDKNEEMQVQWNASFQGSRLSALPSHTVSHASGSRSVRVRVLGAQVAPLGKSKEAPVPINSKMTSQPLIERLGRL